MGERHVLRKVEVSDFRGLGGVRTLDFDGADIVLLHGMNGFGKTSVFDSVEWCLTGKLARYERYTEAGRRQDFGKEKEVLRHKYATQPNTFVKVFLENGTVFGRRILSSGNESDYNMGSIIEGCEFGLTSLSKDSVKEELVNSYFSATHILSQETVNDFVTSKKPEDRYKALSVNFGTSIFSAFETNVQTMLTHLTETEKNIAQQISVKSESLKALNIQIQSQAKGVGEKVKEANALIEKIGKKNGTIFNEPLTFTNDAVSIANSFEQHVSNSKSRARLTYSSVKERLGKLWVLKENTKRWVAENAELKKIEKDISVTKRLLIESDELRKNVSSSSNELLGCKEKLRELESKKVRIESVLQNINHYVNTTKRATALERTIEKRNKEVSEAKAKIPELVTQIEFNKREKETLELKNRSILGILNQIKVNEKLLVDYQNLKNISNENIAKTRAELKSAKSKSGIIRSFIRDIEGAALLPSTLKNLVSQKDGVPLIDTASLEKLDNYIEVFADAEERSSEISSEIRALESNQEELKEQFSKSRQLLSEAITLIDPSVKKILCPVCDVSHETDELLTHIKSKLGENEAHDIQEIAKQLKDVFSAQKQHLDRINTARREFVQFVNDIRQKLQTDVAALTEREIRFEDEIVIKKKNLSELEADYAQLTVLIDGILKDKPRDYPLILRGLESSSESVRQKIAVHEKILNSLQADFDSSQGLVEVATKDNATDLAEVQSLKDSRYDDVREFILKQGLRPNTEAIEDDLNSLQTLVLETESRVRVQIREVAGKIEEYKKKYETLLNGKTETDYKKEVLENEAVIARLKQSLGLLVEHLTSVELSPASYTRESIELLEQEASEKLDKTKEVYSALEGLGALVTEFIKFNSESVVRKKSDKLRKETTELNARLSDIRDVKHSINQLKKQYPSTMQRLIKDNLDVKLFNQIYELLNPHRRFKIIDFKVDVNRNKVGIHFNAKHSKIEGRPEYLFSSAQLNTFGICMFLSMALRQNWLNLDTILIDDPIQNLDDINVLSFIDFLRGLLDSKSGRKQIILSTHDERFYALMLKKFQGYKIKTFKFESYGKLMPE